MEFIVVGGGAGIAHGLARLIQDVDVVYSRRAENLDRIVRALQDVQPYPRGAPAGLPFLWDARTLGAGLNFTLSTKLGLIDFLGEVTGGGSYEQLLPDTVVSEAYGVPIRYVTLPSHGVQKGAIRDILAACLNPAGSLVCSPIRSPTIPRRRSPVSIQRAALCRAAGWMRS